MKNDQQWKECIKVNVESISPFDIGIAGVLWFSHEMIDDGPENSGHEQAHSYTVDEDDPGNELYYLDEMKIHNERKSDGCT